MSARLDVLQSRPQRRMKLHPDTRAEAAIYWAAVSLIVCEGLPIEKAAERLGIDSDRLRDLLMERQALCHFPTASVPPSGGGGAGTH